MDDKLISYSQKSQLFKVVCTYLAISLNRCNVLFYKHSSKFEPTYEQQ